MAYEWTPIEDLPSDAGSLVDPQVAAMVDVWFGRAGELRERQSYKDFLVKLRRQWAIETGVLERLYTLSEGATKTLIEQGLDAALISNTDTDRSPKQVIALIRDQHAVIEGRIRGGINRDAPGSKARTTESTTKSGEKNMTSAPL